MRNHGTSVPLVVESARGCHLQDLEGNRLIDLNMGYGPHIYGYGDEAFAGGLAEQARTAAMTGLPHLLEGEAAELIVDLVPGIEQVRFANSGTEAVASAVRLARYVTGRPLIVTFEGHYHGWSETIWRGGQRLESGQLRGAPGVIPTALDCTLEVQWNDLLSLEAAFAEHGDQIAGIILEPVGANDGVLPPTSGFLKALRRIASQHGSLLVFDEVITGFRVGASGAQGLFGVTPDLTIVSKVMGAGFPVAAFGGDREVMAPLASNVALHAGVYAGNHLAMRAVVMRLGTIQNDSTVYPTLAAAGALAVSQLEEIAASSALDLEIRHCGSVVGMGIVKPGDAKADARGEANRVDSFWPEAHQMLQAYCQNRGLYFHPDPRVPWFLSSVHTSEVIDTAVSLISDGLADVALSLETLERTGAVA